MEKYFIGANELLEASFTLAELIYQSGFRPEFIIGVWRGGAPVGIAVQEYFDLVGAPADHIAIRTSSYYGIDQQQKEVKVFGLNYVIDNTHRDQQLLIVDDVFDSGRSVRAIIDAIQAKAGDQAPVTIKTAFPWYKPSRNVTDLVPDFYLHTTEQWLVFPHELVGLSDAEISNGKGEKIAAIAARAKAVRSANP
jgi:uncharacterized protein